MSVVPTSDELKEAYVATRVWSVGRATAEAEYYEAVEERVIASRRQGIIAAARLIENHVAGYKHESPHIRAGKDIADFLRREAPNYNG